MLARRMVRRRVVGRAVVRTAAVGGVAYAAGHHVAKKSAEQQYMDAQQNAQIEALQQQQAQAAYQQPVYQQQPPSPPMYQQPTYAPPQAAAPAPTGMTQEKLDQLKQLGQLRESGVLTDAEFEAQKQKILNS
jgi:Short C-terminal domain